MIRRATHRAKRWLGNAAFAIEDGRVNPDASVDCCTRRHRGGRCASVALAVAVACGDFVAMLGGRSRRETRCIALRSIPLKQSRRACDGRAPATRSTLPPALLTAPEVASAAHRPPRCREGGARSGAGRSGAGRHRRHTTHATAKPRVRAHRPGGASGTPSSTVVSVGARSALRALARRSCLSGMERSAMQRVLRRDRTASSAGKSPQATVPVKPPGRCARTRGFAARSANVTVACRDLFRTAVRLRGNDGLFSP